MAIPLTPYQGPSFSDLLGAVRGNLEDRLAREKMAMDEARAIRLAEQEQANRERQHQQQMAQFALAEMKFNYEVGQNAPGGLSYLDTMSSINSRNASAKAANAAAALTQARTENPEQFWKPGASSRPRALTAAQQKANLDAAALGQPPPYVATTGSAAADSSVDLPANPDANADPYLVTTPPPEGTETSGTGDSVLFPGGLMPPPLDPLDRTPPSNAPAAAPGQTVVSRGQDPLPMDAASVARRVAMEDARIKRESALSKSLNERRDAAKARLAVDPNDAISTIELQQVEKELNRLLTPPPKAIPVVEEPPIMLDPRYNMAGKTVYLNNGEMSLTPPPPAQTTPPERPGIGLITPPVNKDQAEANKFWDYGKSQATNLANLRDATDEEIQAIANGEGIKDDLGFAGSRPFPELLARQIADRFDMPKGGDKATIKGRRGDVAIKDFIQAAAVDEWRRRKAAKPPAPASEPSPKAKTLTGNWEK